MPIELLLKWERQRARIDPINGKTKFIRLYAILKIKFLSLSNVFLFHGCGEETNAPIICP